MASRENAMRPGPLATLIGLMMWFYITAYAMLFGAEVNAALDREWRKEKSLGTDVRDTVAVKS